MAILDYFWAQSLDAHLEGLPFGAVVMLAMRRADTDNFAALAVAFPELAEELRRRYNAPAGVLESDRLTLAQGLEICEGVRRQARALFEGES